MNYYDRRNQSSIFDSFTLSPLPWPVILILLMVFFFLGISWFLSFEDFIESVEEQSSLALLLVPLILIFIIKWLSSIETFDGFLGFYWNDRRQRAGYGRGDSGGSDGSSPWGVAGLLVLILILASFHSTIQDMWRP
ncbi:hypothetical protein LUZ60_015191 [Juncus effusus]|nr:hypothetical protein LUZ60_015191 [Juncus effusus]